MKFVRRTVALEGVFDNSKGRPFPLRGAAVPLTKPLVPSTGASVPLTGLVYLFTIAPKSLLSLPVLARNFGSK